MVLYLAGSKIGSLVDVSVLFLMAKRLTGLTQPAPLSKARSSGRVDSRFDYAWFHRRSSPILLNPYMPMITRYLRSFETKMTNEKCKKIRTELQRGRANGNMISMLPSKWSLVQYDPRKKIWGFSTERWWAWSWRINRIRFEMAWPST